MIKFWNCIIKSPYSSVTYSCSAYHPSEVHPPPTRPPYTVNYFLHSLSCNQQVLLFIVLASNLPGCSLSFPSPSFEQSLFILPLSCPTLFSWKTLKDNLKRSSTLQLSTLLESGVSWHIKVFFVILQRYICDINRGVCMRCNDVYVNKIC